MCWCLVCMVHFYVTKQHTDRSDEDAFTYASRNLWDADFGEPCESQGL